MQNNAKKARSLFLTISRSFIDQPKIGINYALSEFFLGNEEKAQSPYYQDRFY